MMYPNMEEGRIFFLIINPTDHRKKENKQQRKT